jgi:hypothetical protein
LRESHKWSETPTKTATTTDFEKLHAVAKLFRRASVDWFVVQRESHDWSETFSPGHESLVYKQQVAFSPRVVRIVVWLVAW